MKNIYLIGLVLMTLCISCGDDSVSCEDINLSESLASEIDANNQALIAYTIDSTMENCEVLKESYQTILDALKEYKDCEFNSDDQLEYNNFVQTSETGISLLNC